MPELSRLTLEIDDKGIVTANGNLDIFKKKSADAAKAASNLGNESKKTSNSFLGDFNKSLIGSMTAGSLAADGIKKAVNVIISIPGAITQAAGGFEALETQLRVVSGSVKEADTIFRDLQEFAAKTPFGVEGITNTGIQLMQVGVEANKLKETLTMLGDAAGGSQERLNRIMMNYTQILSVGRATTMDIRQFAMANLPIYQELENVTGKSGESLQQMISTGQITGEVITAAFKRMNQEGGKFYNGMALAAETYQGKVMAMQDSLTNLAAKFGELWLLDFQKNAIDAITKVSDWAAEKLGYIIELRDARDAREAGISTTQQEILLTEDQITVLEGLIRTETLWLDNGEKILSVEGQLMQAELDAARAHASALSMRLRYEQEVDAYRNEYIKNEEARLKREEEIRAEWQAVLKQALNLEEVTTGSQAVSDYLENIETEMNGAIAWAQMYGESVLDVYDEYANKVKKAVEVLLKSGMWKPDENTIQALNNGFESIQLQKEGRQGFTNPGINQPAQDPAFMQQDPFALGDFNNPTGFNINATESDYIWLEEEKVRREEEQAERLKEIYKGLGDQLKQLAADAAFDAFWDMGEALYEGGDAAQAFGRSLLQSILQNVPAMLFQAGFKLLMAGGVIPGLALMAMSGIAGAGAGYLNAALNDSGDSGDSERAELESLVDRLEKIIDRTREETKYYSEYIRNYNANSVDVQAVQDAIIAPGGKVITTAPNDYLIATKTPGALGGGAQNISISVINNAGDVANAQATTKKNDDGTTQIVVMVEKLVGSGIASGKYDTAFDAMQNRRSGIRRGT